MTAYDSMVDPIRTSNATRGRSAVAILKAVSALVRKAMTVFIVVVISTIVAIVGRTSKLCNGGSSSARDYESGRTVHSIREAPHPQ